MKYQELPNDLASEKAIFSILLNNPNRITEVVDLLSVKDFFSNAHQNIWEAMKTLFLEGQDIDIVSIKNQLKKQEVSVSSVLKELTECYEEQVNDSNLNLFIAEIKNKSLLRQIIRSSKGHLQNASLEGTQATDLLNAIEKDTLEILDQAKDVRLHDAEGIITELNQDIEKGGEHGWQGYETGFPTLDEKTGGLIPTQAWIIGAYTGVGKTFFILQMILNVLRQGGKVVLFSTEMDRKINMLRLIGNIAGLGTINMMRGKLLDNEKEEMDKAQEELRKYKDNLTIYDNVYTLADIRLKTKKLKVTKGVDVVAVDFIQNLKGGDSIYERMSEAAVGLQQMAQELRVCLLLGSQVSQASAGWQSKEAIEFKGAGEIAAISDVAIWISKTEGDPSLRKVMIRKIRHGSPGKFEVRLNFPSGQIVDMQKSDGGEEDVKGQL